MLPLPRGAVWQMFFLLCAVLLVNEARSEGRVVCYYTNWSVYRPGAAKFNPQNINPYLCTHLVYAFGGFTKDNTMKPFDKYQDIEQGGYAKFTGLKTYNKQLKTMIAIGGWNEASSRFSPLVANSERRQQFVKNILKFLRQNHFDGIDLDWEYPAHRDGGKARDKDNYAQFVQELRAEFDRESAKTGRPRLLLTMAVPAGIQYIEKGYDIPKLNQYLDWFNMLTYDFHSSHEPSANHHAPLFSLEEDDEYNFDTELNIDYSVKYYLNAGADRDKLVLGIPTYGRSYTLINEDSTDLGAPADGPGEQGDATREKGYLAYYEICQNIKEDPDWNVVQPNPSAMGPYAFKGNQWVGYDDEAIVRKKAEYVVENGLGGIMFWAIDNDDFRGTCTGKPYPLIEAAKEAYLDRLGLGDNEVAKPASKKKPLRSRTRIGSSNRNKVEEIVEKAVAISRKRPSTTKRPQSQRRTTTGTTTTTTGSSLYIGGRTTTPEPPTTPDPGSDFKCEDEGFFQHPRDCKKYFWCLDSGPSNLGIVAHQFTCPSGLYFNPAADSCDFARNVPCNKNPKEAPSTTSKPSTTTTTTTARTTTASSRITAATSRNSFIRFTSTTTQSPEDDDEEYEDEDEPAIPESEEDPRVIKELIDLIKKVGGIEELEKHLLQQEDGTVMFKKDELASSGLTTTPPSISKSLYDKVLSRPNLNAFRTKFTSSTLFRSTSKPKPVEESEEEDVAVKSNSGSKYSSVVRNSRPGPQNAGIDKLPEFEGFLKEKKKYVTIQRTRPLLVSSDEVSTEEDEVKNSLKDADEEDEDDDEVNVKFSSRRPTSSSTPAYTSIRRTKSTTLKPDVVDDGLDDELIVDKKTYTPLNRNRVRSTPADIETTTVGGSRYKFLERTRPTRRPAATDTPREDVDEESNESDGQLSVTVQYTDQNEISTQTPTQQPPTTTIRAYASLGRRTTTTPSSTTTDQVPTTSTSTTPESFVIDTTTPEPIIITTTTTTITNPISIETSTESLTANPIPAFSTSTLNPSTSQDDELATILPKTPNSLATESGLDTQEIDSTQNQILTETTTIDDTNQNEVTNLSTKTATTRNKSQSSLNINSSNSNSVRGTLNNKFPGGGRRQKTTTASSIDTSQTDQESSTTTNEFLGTVSSPRPFGFPRRRTRPTTTTTIATGGLDDTASSTANPTDPSTPLVKKVSSAQESYLRSRSRLSQNVDRAQNVNGGTSLVVDHVANVVDSLVKVNGVSQANADGLVKARTYSWKDARNPTYRPQKTVPKEELDKIAYYYDWQIGQGGRRDDERFAQNGGWSTVWGQVHSPSLTYRDGSRYGVGYGGGLNGYSGFSGKFNSGSYTPDDRGKWRGKSLASDGSIFRRGYGLGGRDILSTYQYGESNAGGDYVNRGSRVYGDQGEIIYESSGDAFQANADRGDERYRVGYDAGKTGYDTYRGWNGHSLVQVGKEGEDARAKFEFGRQNYRTGGESDFNGSGDGAAGDETDSYNGVQGKDGPQRTGDGDQVYVQRGNYIKVGESTTSVKGAGDHQKRVSPEEITETTNIGTRTKVVAKTSFGVGTAYSNTRDQLKGVKEIESTSRGTDFKPLGTANSNTRDQLKGVKETVSLKSLETENTSRGTGAFVDFKPLGTANSNTRDQLKGVKETVPLKSLEIESTSRGTGEFVDFKPLETQGPVRFGVSLGGTSVQNSIKSQLDTTGGLEASLQDSVKETATGQALEILNQKGVGLSTVNINGLESLNGSLSNSSSQRTFEDRGIIKHNVTSHEVKLISESEAGSAAGKSNQTTSGNVHKSQLQGEDEESYARRRNRNRLGSNIDEEIITVTNDQTEDSIKRRNQHTFNVQSQSDQQKIDLSSDTKEKTRTQQDRINSGSYAGYLESQSSGGRVVDESVYNNKNLSIPRGFSKFSIEEGSSSGSSVGGDQGELSIKAETENSYQGSAVQTGQKSGTGSISSSTVTLNNGSYESSFKNEQSSQGNLTIVSESDNHSADRSSNNQNVAEKATVTEIVDHEKTTIPSLSQQDIALTGSGTNLVNQSNTENSTLNQANKTLSSGFETLKTLSSSLGESDTRNTSEYSLSSKSEKTVENSDGLTVTNSSSDETLSIKLSQDPKARDSTQDGVRRITLVKSSNTTTTASGNTLGTPARGRKIVTSFGTGNTVNRTAIRTQTRYRPAGKTNLDESLKASVNKTKGFKISSVSENTNLTRDTTGTGDFNIETNKDVSSSSQSSGGTSTYTSRTRISGQRRTYTSTAVPRTKQTLLTTRTELRSQGSSDLNKQAVVHTSGNGGSVDETEYSQETYYETASTTTRRPRVINRGTFRPKFNDLSSLLALDVHARNHRTSSTTSNPQLAVRRRRPVERTTTEASVEEEIQRSPRPTRPPRTTTTTEAPVPTIRPTSSRIASGFTRRPVSNWNGQTQQDNFAHRRKIIRNRIKTDSTTSAGVSSTNLTTEDQTLRNEQLKLKTNLLNLLNEDASTNATNGSILAESEVKVDFQSGSQVGTEGESNQDSVSKQNSSTTDSSRKQIVRNRYTFQTRTTPTEVTTETVEVVKPTIPRGKSRLNLPDLSSLLSPDFESKRKFNESRQSKRTRVYQTNNGLAGKTTVGSKVSQSTKEIITNVNLKENLAGSDLTSTTETESEVQRVNFGGSKTYKLDKKITGGIHKAGFKSETGSQLDGSGVDSTKHITGGDITTATIIDGHSHLIGGGHKTTIVTETTGQTITSGSNLTQNVGINDLDTSTITGSSNQLIKGGVKTQIEVTKHETTALNVESPTTEDIQTATEELIATLETGFSLPTQQQTVQTSNEGRNSISFSSEKSTNLLTGEVLHSKKGDDSYKNPTVPIYSRRNYYNYLKDSPIIYLGKIGGSNEENVEHTEEQRSHHSDHEINRTIFDVFDVYNDSRKTAASKNANHVGEATLKPQDTPPMTEADKNAIAYEINNQLNNFLVPAPRPTNDLGAEEGSSAEAVSHTASGEMNDDIMKLAFDVNSMSVGSQVALLDGSGETSIEEPDLEKDSSVNLGPSLTAKQGKALFHKSIQSVNAVEINAMMDHSVHSEFTTKKPFGFRSYEQVTNEDDEKAVTDIPFEEPSTTLYASAEGKHGDTLYSVISNEEEFKVATEAKTDDEITVIPSLDDFESLTTVLPSIRYEGEVESSTLIPLETDLEADSDTSSPLELFETKTSTKSQRPTKIFKDRKNYESSTLIPLETDLEADSDTSSPLEVYEIKTSTESHKKTFKDQRNYESSTLIPLETDLEADSDTSSPLELNEINTESHKPGRTYKGQRNYASTTLTPLETDLEAESETSSPLKAYEIKTSTKSRRPPKTFKDQGNLESSTLIPLETDLEADSDTSSPLELYETITSTESHNLGRTSKDQRKYASTTLTPLETDIEADSDTSSPLEIYEIKTSTKSQRPAKTFKIQGIDESTTLIPLETDLAADSDTSSPLELNKIDTATKSHKSAKTFEGQRNYESSTLIPLDTDLEADSDTSSPLELYEIKTSTESHRPGKTFKNQGNDDSSTLIPLETDLEADSDTSSPLEVNEIDSATESEIESHRAAKTFKDQRNEQVSLKIDQADLNETAHELVKTSDTGSYSDQRTLKTKQRSQINTGAALGASRIGINRRRKPTTIETSTEAIDGIQTEIPVTGEEIDETTEIQEAATAAQPTRNIKTPRRLYNSRTNVRISSNSVERGEDTENQTESILSLNRIETSNIGEFIKKDDAKANTFSSRRNRIGSSRFELLNGADSKTESRTEFNEDEENDIGQTELPTKDGLDESSPVTTRRQFGGFSRPRTTLSPSSLPTETLEIPEKKNATEIDSLSRRPTIGTRRNFGGVSRIRTTTVSPSSETEASQDLEENSITEIENLDQSTVSNTRRTFKGFNRPRPTSASPIQSTGVSEFPNEDVTTENSDQSSAGTTRRTFNGFNRFRSTTASSSLPPEGSEVPEEDVTTDIDNLEQSTAGPTRRTFNGFNRLRTTTASSSLAPEGSEVPEEDITTDIESLDQSTAGPTRRTFNGFNRLRTTTASSRSASDGSEVPEEDITTDIESLDQSTAGPTRRTFNGFNRLRTTTASSSLAPEGSEVPEEDITTDIESLDQSTAGPTRRTFNGFNRLRTTTASSSLAPEGSEVPEEDITTDIKSLDQSTAGPTRRTFNGFNRLRTTTASSSLAPEGSEVPEEDITTDIESLDQSTAGPTRRTFNGFNRLRTTTASSSLAPEGSEVPEEDITTDIESLDQSTAGPTRRTFGGFNRLRTTTASSSLAYEGSQVPEEDITTDIESLDQSTAGPTRRTFNGFNRLRTTTASSSLAPEGSESPEEDITTDIESLDQSTAGPTRRTFNGFNRLRTTTASSSLAPEGSEVPEEDITTDIESLDQSTAGPTRRTLNGFNRLRTTTASSSLAPEGSEVPDEDITTDIESLDQSTAGPTRRTFNGFNRLRTTTASSSLAPEGSEVPEEDITTDIESLDQTPAGPTRRTFSGFNRLRTTTASSSLAPEGSEVPDEDITTDFESLDQSTAGPTRRTFNGFNRLRTTTASSSLAPEGSENSEEDITTDIESLDQSTAGPTRRTFNGFNRLRTTTASSSLAPEGSEVPDEDITTDIESLDQSTAGPTRRTFNGFNRLRTTTASSSLAPEGSEVPEEDITTDIESLDQTPAGPTRRTFSGFNRLRTTTASSSLAPEGSEVPDEDITTDIESLDQSTAGPTRRTFNGFNRLRTTTASSSLAPEGSEVPEEDITTDIESLDQSTAGPTRRTFSGFNRLRTTTASSSLAPEGSEVPEEDITTDIESLDQSTAGPTRRTFNGFNRLRTTTASSSLAPEGSEVPEEDITTDIESLDQSTAGPTRRTFSGFNRLRTTTASSRSASDGSEVPDDDITTDIESLDQSTAGPTRRTFGGFNRLRTTTASSILASEDSEVSEEDLTADIENLEQNTAGTTRRTFNGLNRFRTTTASSIVFEDNENSAEENNTDAENLDQSNISPTRRTFSGVNRFRTTTASSNLPIEPTSVSEQDQDTSRRGFNRFKSTRFFSSKITGAPSDSEDDFEKSGDIVNELENLGLDVVAIDPSLRNGADKNSDSTTNSSSGSRFSTSQRRPFGFNRQTLSTTSPAPIENEDQSSELEENSNVTGEQSEDESSSRSTPIFTNAQQQVQSNLNRSSTTRTRFQFSGRQNSFNRNQAFKPQTTKENEELVEDEENRDSKTDESEEVTARNIVALLNRNRFKAISSTRSEASDSQDGDVGKPRPSLLQLSERIKSVQSESNGDSGVISTRLQRVFTNDTSFNLTSILNNITNQTITNFTVDTIENRTDTNPLSLNEANNLDIEQTELGQNYDSEPEDSILENNSNLSTNTPNLNRRFQRVQFNRTAVGRRRPNTTTPITTTTTTTTTTLTQVNSSFDDVNVNNNLTSATNLELTTETESESESDSETGTSKDIETVTSTEATPKPRRRFKVLKLKRPLIVNNSLSLEVNNSTNTATVTTTTQTSNNRTGSVENSTFSLDNNSTQTGSKRFRKVIRRLRPVANRTVTSDETTTIFNGTTKQLNVAEFISKLNENTTTVSSVTANETSVTSDENLTTNPTISTEYDTTISELVDNEVSTSETTLVDSSATSPAPLTPRRLLINRRPYKPTKPSINAITSTDSSISIATQRTYVRKFNRNFKAIRPPTDSANGIGFIEQPRPQTGFAGRNRFNFPTRTTTQRTQLENDEEDEDNEEEDYDEATNVNQEDDERVEGPVIRPNILFNQNRGQGQTYNSQEEDTEVKNDDDENTEDADEEDEDEDEEDEKNSKISSLSPQVVYRPTRPSTRPSFNRPGNTPFVPNRPSAPSPANRFVNRAQNKTRVVNRPTLITLPPNLLDSDNPTVTASITPPSVFISTNTRSYERKYSASSTEGIPQDQSNPLLEDLNIDALNARNKKIFESNSKKHTTIKPKLIQNQPQPDTTDTPTNSFDTTTVIDEDNEDNNLINSQDASEQTTIEAITEQPSPASEGELILYSPKQKLVTINRVVEINSKEDKLRRKSKDELLQTVESTHLRPEGMPKLEALGEISRVKYVHLVDGSKILVDGRSSVTDYTPTESSAFVRNTIPEVAPDSLENTRIDYEPGSTSAPYRNSIPDMDYSSSVTDSASDDRKSKAITIPEVIVDVIESSTISLEGLFDTARQAKKISEASNEVNGIFYAYSLGEVPTTPKNEKPRFESTTPTTTTTTTTTSTTTTTTTTTPKPETTTTTTTTEPLQPTVIAESADDTTTESTTAPVPAPLVSRPLIPLLRPESNEFPLVRTAATTQGRRPGLRRRLYTTAQPVASASNDELNTDSISTISPDDDAVVASTSPPATTSLFKYNRRTRPSFPTTIVAKLKPTAKVLSSSSQPSSSPGEISTIATSTTGSAAVASSNDVTFVTVNKLPNQKFPSGVIRRKFIRPLNASRSTTTPAPGTTIVEGSGVASEEVVATTQPRTQNPLFKRRFPPTTTAAPLTTVHSTEFNTSPLYLDTVIPEDIDQVAKSSIQNAKIIHNQIGDTYSESKHSPDVSISTKLFRSTTPYYTSKDDEAITRRLDIIVTTRRPLLRRPQKTTPSPEKAPIFISQRRPHKTPAPFNKIIQSPTPGRTHKPVLDYDYYDDGDERVVDKPTASQVKVVLHGKGIIECLDQGNFPHPLSCRKFISCAKFENGGVVGWEYTCPKGLSYDPVGGICNWAAGLGCKE